MNDMKIKVFQVRYNTVWKALIALGADTGEIEWREVKDADLGVLKILSRMLRGRCGHVIARRNRSRTWRVDWSSRLGEGHSKLSWIREGAGRDPRHIKHKAHIQKVLCRLCTNRLFAHADKCDSMSLPVNTSGCHLKASPWPHTKSRSTKIGQYHKKSRIFNIFLALPNSTVSSFTDILKSQFHLCVLTCKGTPVHFSMSATPPLKHSKRLFTTAPFLTHWILDTQITIDD